MISNRSSSVYRVCTRRGIAAASAVLMLALTVSVQAQGHGEDQDRRRRGRDAQPIVLTVDVAEDLAAKFVPTFVKPEHAQPERGAFYVTEGRVFPAGTIEGDGTGFNPNRTGHVGIWISRGTHLASASEIPAAQLWAHTAQLFVLGRQGIDQIATEGVEGSGTRTRVITGTAGNYVGFVGEQRQTFLGFNQTGGVNLRVTFTLWPAVAE